MRAYIARFLKWLSSFFEIDIPVAPSAPIVVDNKEQKEVKKEPEIVKEEIKEEVKEEKPKEESEDDFSIYNPKERLIYKYWNGKELVVADPMTLYKKVMDVGPELAINFQLAKSASKDAKEGHNSLISSIRNVFNVQSLEDTPEGLGQTETMMLLNHFLAYCNRLKKNSRMFATTSSLSEDSHPTSQPDQPTPNTSDYGSTENEQSSEKPLP